VAEAALHRLIRGTANLAALLLLLTVISNALAVVFRYVIGQPLIWTEEVQRYLMIWVAFLGGAACLGLGEHMAMDLVGMLLPRRFQRLLRIALLALTALFCTVLIWKGIPLALGNNSQLSPAARVPMSYPYLAVGVGGLLMLIAAVLRICIEMQRRGSEEEPTR
jgi:TRAP-type C4-dicarboxylate transport system permease small subunit